MSNKLLNIDASISTKIMINWCNNNKLIINNNKTQFLQSQTHQKKTNSSQLIWLNGKFINKTKEVDLVSGSTVTVVSHDSKIDWLELNETGHKLLFRDKKMRLTLFDNVNKQKTSILSYCTFVQWVPGSDVVVAQSRNNLCVWYNINVPDQITMFPIKGEIVDVVRADGTTEVIVQEGHHELGYKLDEGLVEFDTAIQDKDFGRAIMFLEGLGGLPEAEGMWRNLATIAITSNKLHVAERCYAALGDRACTRYLQETREIADEYAKSNDEDGSLCPDVLARMAILKKRLKEAESVYLEQNQLEKALKMYQNLHKWDEAVALAELKGYPKYKQLREDQLHWLINNRQEERAGELMEKDGDYKRAALLYLNAEVPARTFRLMENNEDMYKDDELVNKVLSHLLDGGLHEQAGQVYEKINQTDKALKCYKKGEAFAKAIELARQVSPADVVPLEDQWGDHLVLNKQLDSAINHYIEAGKTVKALEAAVEGKQWKKSAHILKAIEDPNIISKHYAQVAQHFATIRDFAYAESLYVHAGNISEAIDMYNNAGEWDRGFYLATQHLEPNEVSTMYTAHANALESQGDLHNAEILYIAISQPDMAITMYKRYNEYDKMMHLIEKYHPDLVETTHTHLAHELQSQNKWKEAEEHYLAGGDWKGAVNMYRAADRWEDAYRVAKASGGLQASQQVAFLWAKSLGGESAIKLLTKFNLLEFSVDYACEIFQFDFAFDLTRNALKSKLPDVHYKYAIVLEDDGKFAEAEGEFIKAGKPKEAVLMYVHNQDWENAQRIAEQYDSDSLTQVLLRQANDAFATKNFSHFESLLLRAEKPELIIKQYQEGGMWVDALRVCREHLSSHLPALQAEYDREVDASSSGDTVSLMSQAREWEKSGEYKAAIDCYLKMTPSTTEDKGTLIKAWSRATTLTVTHLEAAQAAQIAKILGPRLVDIGELNTAAQLYLGADHIKEAIDAFIIAEEWNKAKKVATELDTSYEAYVDDRYKSFLRNQGRADQLADVDIIGALDLLSEQKQWIKCLETAKQHGPQVLHKYVALYATELIKDGFTLEALNLYIKYDAPLFPQNYNIYKRIAVNLFNMPGMSGSEAYNSWSKLRNVLFNLTEAMKISSDAGSAVHEQFDILLLICHYYATRSACKNIKTLDLVVAKISTSLLRHTDIIPADKAFFEAGIHCRDVGRDNEAFVFLNYYLDVCEAIEEGNADLLDNSDFVATDFPVEIPLPENLYLPSEQYEEIKDWVLTMSIDKKVSQVLSLDERGLFESSLTSNGGAGAVTLPCIVSGYPVLAQRGRTPVEFKRPGKLANREDWNKLLLASKMNPDSQIGDVISFIGEWCGGTPDYCF